jgi:peroxiredoxin
LLGNIKVTDEGVAALAGLRKLQVLDVSGRITNSGLARLEGMPALRWLNLDSATGFSPIAVDRLRQKTPSLQAVSTAGPPRDAKPAPKPGEKAPALELDTLDGKWLRLADLRGKAVLLYFWATWCGPCVASTPALKDFHAELSREYPDGFVMVGISLDDVALRHMPQRYAERHGLAWPQACVGPEADVVRDYAVDGVPHVVLVAPDGTVAVADTRDFDLLKKQVRQLLGAPAPQTR